MSKLEFVEMDGRLYVKDDGKTVSSSDKLKKLADWLNSLYVGSHHLTGKQLAGPWSIPKGEEKPGWKAIEDDEEVKEKLRRMDPEEVTVSGPMKGKVNVEGTS